MKIIHPSVEYLSQANTLDGIWKHAARCARVCYQSAPHPNIKVLADKVKELIEHM